MVPRELLDMVVRWEVLDEESFSDHRYISFELYLGQPELIWHKIIRKTDRGVFREYLTVGLEDLPEPKPYRPPRLRHGSAI